MTHDPLCPVSRRFRPSCECDFIAEVRADTLRRPSEDGWMSVRAVLAWEDRVRADEREQAVQRLKDFQTTVLSGLFFYPMGDFMDGLIEKVIRGEQT